MLTRTGAAVAHVNVEERLQRIHATIAAISAARTPRQVAEAVFEHGLEAMGASGAALSWEVSPGVLKVLHETGFGKKALEDYGTFRAEDPVPAADAFRTGTPVWLGTADAIRSAYPHCEEYRALQRDEAWAALPLVVDGRAVGTLGLTFARPQPFGDDDRVFIETLADQCAQALDRARLLEAARESERQLDRILSLTPDLVVRYAPDGRVMFANPAAAVALGLEKTALVGKTPREFGIPERDAQWWDSVLGDVAGSRVERSVDRAYVLGGVERHFHTRLVPEIGPDGRVHSIVAVSRELTERKRGERALADAAARFRAAIDSFPYVYVIYDSALRFVFVNRAAVEKSGFAEDEMIGRRDDELFPRTVTDTYLPHLRKALQTRTRQTFESTHTLPSGTTTILCDYVPLLDDRGEVREVLGITTDITERKRSEELLRKSEARFRSVLDGSRDVIYRVNIQTGQHEYISPSCRSVIGYTADFLAVHDAPGTLGLVFPDDLATVRDAIARLERTGVEEVEYRQRTESGEYRWMSNRMSLVRDDAGRPLYRDGNIRDITERKRAQEALVDADRRKNEFLAVLSHELRNPLAPIKNSLYILDRAPAGGDQARRARHVINRQVTYLTRLVDDLLDVTRITRNKIPLRREAVDVNDLVRRVVEDQRSLFDEGGIALTVDTSNAPVVVHGDGARLAQVVSNLLQNAAKFTACGGRTDVTVERDVAAQRAVIRVHDTGVGMDAGTLGRLFEPFMQADATLDRSRGGLGLGLALVKGLVELHGGEVTASSKGLGKGSELVVRIPVAADRTSGLEKDGAQVARGGQPSRILVIEDNVDAANTLRDALELRGHAVEVAHTGRDGIATAATFRPEVVLCDIGLPGMDGYEVARAFRGDDRLRGIGLVALSGYASPDDVQRALDAGFERHLAKPPNVEEIEAVFEALKVAQP